MLIGFAGYSTWSSSVELLSLLNNTILSQDDKKNNKLPQMASPQEPRISFPKTGPGRIGTWSPIPQIRNL